VCLLVLVELPSTFTDHPKLNVCISGLNTLVNRKKHCDVSQLQSITSGKPSSEGTPFLAFNFIGKFAFSEGSSEATGTHLSPHVHFCPLLQPSNVTVSLLLTFYFRFTLQNTKARG
jgi:hypothetical protein